MWHRDPNITWEERHGGNTREVHYRGISDDQGRLMAIICHNTDLGDGWEHDVEVLGGGDAAPWVRLTGRAAERAEALGVAVEISLTHSKGMAGAVAMLR